MAKTVYIGQENGMYYLEISGKNEDNIPYRKRTNVMSKIKNYLSREGKYFIDGNIRGDNLFLYTTNHTCFILQDYQSLDYEAFKEFFIRVQTAPIVSKNLKNNVRSNPLQLLGLRVLYQNRMRLATLAMTGVLAVSGNFILASGKTHLHQKQDVEPSMVSDIVTEEVNAQAPVLSIDSIDNRLRQTSYLQEQYGEYNRNRIMVGARVDINRMQDILASMEGKTIIDTANTYGIDPYLLLAKGLAESNLNHESHCPNGRNYNGYGVGAFQLESPDGRMVKAWNFDKNCEDTLSITMENAMDFSKNTQAAAMYLQERLEKYHNNIYLALQSYNYGENMMDLVIHDYAKEKGITEEDVINNTTDLGWLAIVEDIHNNPNDYYYRVALNFDETNQEKIDYAKRNYVWKHKTYGNDCYIFDVLSYYVGLQSKNKNVNGTSTVVDFSDFESLQLPENKAKTM